MTNSNVNDPDLDEIGKKMYGWVTDLFPICRSLTGDGVRQTLSYINDLLPEMKIHAVPSGTQAFDWVIPDEWNIRDAYLEDEEGNRIIDFKDSNLHVVGYSEPVDKWLDLSELEDHLFSLPDRPDYIPYATSYYARRWGFCLTHKQRMSLKPGKYHAVIDSTLAPGVLNYGELILKGKTDKEVLISTYVCHPSMANNELSGPAVATALAQYLSSIQDRNLTYRIIFSTETLGSIVYLSRNLAEMKANTIAGFVLTCIGDDRDYSMMESRNGDTLADRVVRHALQHGTEHFSSYSFLTRGSDERQYCSPGVNLPVVGVMRSKYATYPEYHTSADNLDLVTPTGLSGGYRILRDCLTILERYGRYKTVTLCEPQLSKRGLYPSMSAEESGLRVRDMSNVIAYCDGENDLIEVADKINLSALKVIEFLDQLMDHDLIEKVAD